MGGALPERSWLGGGGESVGLCGRVDGVGHWILIFQNVLNQVARSYDPFGRLARDAQAHAGEAGTGTPAVYYRHDEGGDGTEEHPTNSARLTEIVYPDGRAIRLGYGDPGSIDDTLSRLAIRHDRGTCL